MKALTLLLILVSSSAFARESLIVTLSQERFASRAQVRADSERMLKALSSYPRLRGIEPVFSGSERKVLDQLGQSSTAHAYLVHVESADEAAALKRWIQKKQESRQMPQVSVEHNSRARLNDAPVGDPLLPRQWGLRNVGDPQRIALDDVTFLPVPGQAGEDLAIPAVLAPIAPERRALVAILDTGVDATHPDLKGRLLRKQGECDALAQFKTCMTAAAKDPAKEAACSAQWSKVDTDGNGYPMDCVGWNLTGAVDQATGILGNPDTNDEFGHGTHVAGIVGAEANGAGVQGASQGVTILPVKVIRGAINAPVRPQDDAKPQLPSPLESELAAEGGLVDVVARGMLYAIRSGAQVINISISWPAGADSALMRRMVQLAQSRGIVVVSSAGNDATDSRVYPCAYAGVVCVASHGPDGKLSHFSNHGSAVEIAAPGLQILSTWPMARRAQLFTQEPGYEYRNGTSMSSPAVAGLLGTLRALGMSADEAKARLLSGARPMPKGAPVESLTGQPTGKHVMTGNADLSRALSQSPRPWLERSAKEAVQLDYAELRTRYPFTIELRNIWGAGASCAISARADVADAKVSVQGVPTTWPAGDSRTLRLELQIMDAWGKPPASISGRIAATLEVNCAGARQRIEVPLELSRVIDGATPLDIIGSESLAVEGAVLSPSEIRGVSDLSGADRQDYLAIQKSEKEWKLQWIRDSGTLYVAEASATIPAPGRDLLTVQKFDFDAKFPGDELVLVLRTQPQNGQPLPGNRFVVLSAKLEPVAQFDYDNGMAALPDRFRWVRVDGETRAAWIGYGPMPAADLPAPDPFDGPAANSSVNRFYTLGVSGIREIPAPSGQFWIEMLSDPARADLARPMPVLLGKGKDYWLEYSVVSLANAQVADQKRVDLPTYHMLAGLLNVQASVSLSTGQASGTVFGTSDPSGTLRFTRIGAQSVAQGFAQPGTRTESVNAVRALFDGAGRSALFAETHYDLRYQDQASGEEAAISLDRFSYLPAFITARSMFPVVVAHGYQSFDRLPGMLIPRGLGSSIAAEVIVPIYSSAGKLVELRKPAELRLRAGQGCVLVDNPRPATDRRESTWGVFCGNQLKRIPIRTRK